MTAREAMRLIPIPRMWHWYIVVAVLMIGLALLQPQQVNVVAYKVLLLALATAIAHTIDRQLFAHESDNIDAHRDVLAAARVLARGCVYLGTVLGVTLGI